MTVVLRKFTDGEGRCFLFRADDGGAESEVRKRGMWGNKDAAKFDALVDDYIGKLEQAGFAVSYNIS